MWRPTLSTADQLWRAHLQLQHWRKDGDPEKITYWYRIRDQLLDDRTGLPRRPLDTVDPLLAARLTITPPKPTRGPHV